MQSVLHRAGAQHWKAPICNYCCVRTLVDECNLRLLKLRLGQLALPIAE